MDVREVYSQFWLSSRLAYVLDSDPSLLCGAHIVLDLIAVTTVTGLLLRELYLACQQCYMYMEAKESIKHDSIGIGMLPVIVAPHGIRRMSNNDAILLNTVKPVLCDHSKQYIRF